MDELMKVRQQIKPLAQAAGLPNFTLMPLLVKATSLALADYPILNSQISCVSATSGDGPGRPEAMWASWHLFGPRGTRLGHAAPEAADGRLSSSQGPSARRFHAADVSPPPTLCRPGRTGRS